MFFIVKIKLERYCEIERDNALLLAKMSTISRGKGQIDTSEPNRHNKYSMNIYVRTKDQSRIQEENQAIVHRIQKRKGELDHSKLDAQWKETEQHIDRICEYPFALGKEGPRGRKRVRSKSVGPGKTIKRGRGGERAHSETREEQEPEEGGYGGGDEGEEQGEQKPSDHEPPAQEEKKEEEAPAEGEKKEEEAPAEGEKKEEEAPAEGEKKEEEAPATGEAVDNPDAQQTSAETKPEDATN